MGEVFLPLLEGVRMWSAAGPGPLPAARGSLMAPQRAEALAGRLALAFPAPWMLAWKQRCQEADEPALRLATFAAAWLSGHLETVYRAALALLQHGDEADALRYADLCHDLAFLAENRSVEFKGALLAARTLHRAGRHEESVSRCIQALEVGESDVPAAWLSTCLDLLGLQLTHLGRVPQAVDAYDQALALPMPDRERLTTRMNRAFLLVSAGYVARPLQEYEGIVAAAREADSAYPLAQLLDNYGTALIAGGQLARAAEVLAEAGTLITAQPVEDRLVNILLRQDVALQLDDAMGARRLFEEAYDLGVANRQVSPDAVSRYRAGLRSALDTMLPKAHPAAAAFLTGVAASSAGEPGTARAAFSTARATASAAGDELLSLRAAVNLSSVCFDVGDNEQARRLATEALHAGRARGLAVIESLAASSLVTHYSLAFDRVQILLLGPRAVELTGLHSRLLQELLASGGAPSPDIWGPGVAPFLPGSLHNQLGLFCHSDGGNPERAVSHLREAVRLAREWGDLRSEGNRLANLALALRDLPGDGASGELIAIRSRMQELLDADLPDPARIILRLALLDEAEEGSPTGLAELREVAGLLEVVRCRQDTPESRAGIDRNLPARRRLTNALVRASRDAEAWEALQEERARALLERLSADRANTPYRPPRLDEAADLLSRVGDRTALVDVLLIDGHPVAFVVDASGVRRVEVPGTLSDLDRAIGGDPLNRASEIVAAVRSNAVLQSLASAVCAATGDGADLLLCMDDGLSNLPLHLVPVDGLPWGARQVLGRLPALGLLRPAFSDQGLRGRSLVAGDSRGDLPGAAEECAALAGLLGQDALVQGDCTLPAVQAALVDADLGIVHLAVHGYADPRHGDRSTLLFAADDGRSVWAPFEQLAALPWRARLVVFSGCSTAVSGPRFGTGTYGLPELAMENGAGSVLASLWPIDDHRTSRLMKALYEELLRDRSSGKADLRIALARAGEREANQQTADEGTTTVHTRNARELELEEPPLMPEQRSLALSPADAFIVVGDPVLRF